MGEIIELRTGIRRDPRNPVSSEPWEFRRAPWQTSHFVQILRSSADKMEAVGRDSPMLPPHFSLKGGTACVIRAMYVNRGQEEKMRDIYYAAGLTDCMINRVNPILRTDILRAMYKKVFAMKEALNMHWRGDLDQVLLPIDQEFYDSLAYGASIGGAKTMKELYRVIRRGTDEMFDILAREYVFYCPWMGV